MKLLHAGGTTRASDQILFGRRQLVDLCLKTEATIDRPLRLPQCLAVVLNQVDRLCLVSAWGVVESQAAMARPPEAAAMIRLSTRTRCKQVEGFNFVSHARPRPSDGFERKQLTSVQM